MVGNTLYIPIFSIVEYIDELSDVIFEYVLLLAFGWEQIMAVYRNLKVSTNHSIEFYKFSL